jgi:hypothetical protein
VEAFRRIFAHTSLPQIIVSTKDLHASIERVSSFAQINLAHIADSARVSRAAHPQPTDLQSPYEAPRNEVEQKLARIWLPTSRSQVQ